MAWSSAIRRYLMLFRITVLAGRLSLRPSARKAYRQHLDC